MGQIHNGVKRGRGRPPIRPDDDTRHLIIDAAGQEFQANGYAATCMEDVAQRAGVSTKTLYRLIPTKADLFKSVVSDRIGRFLLEIDDEVVVALDLAAALEHILIAYGALALATSRGFDTTPSERGSAKYGRPSSRSGTSSCVRSWRRRRFATISGRSWSAP